MIKTMIVDGLQKTYVFKYNIGDIVSGISPKGAEEVHLILDHEITKIPITSEQIPVYRTVRLDSERVSLYGRKYIENMEVVA